MSKEGPAAKIVREGEEQGLTPNEIRMKIGLFLRNKTQIHSYCNAAEIYHPSAWKNAFAAPRYIPWEKDKLELFATLVQKDKDENFKQRTRYYLENGLIKEEDNWLQFVMNGKHKVNVSTHHRQGGHAVYAVQDAPHPIAFSIGLYYWHGVPEIMIEIKNAPNDRLGKNKL
jgi:hypothetical protein